jgi:GNAT superfamily N-acetyltransferase
MEFLNISKMEMKIRRPRIDELSLLSSLALRSKAYWGYDNEFIEMCREELTVKKRFLEEHEIFIGELEQKITGFYVLEEINANKTELSFLFIEPQFIKNGIGKKLFAHAIRLAFSRNYRSIIIQSDPFAEAFYLKMGAVKIGIRPSSSISNRDLPLLEYKLRSKKSDIRIEDMMN